MLCPTCNSHNSDNATVCHACAGALSHKTVGDAAPDALGAGTPLQNGALRVERVLGIGGFGITYQGLDAHLCRTVAIKEFFPYGCKRAGQDVHPPAAMPEAEFQSARQRFLDEAQVLAQFRHPGIVAVHSFFEENNTAYMVMEFLQGHTLGQLVEKRGPLPEAEAISLIGRAALALSEVHRGTLLHRDIKPENIFATGDNRVVLIDFGTAREFAIGKTRQMTVTLTPGYAPLEQYAQRAQRGPYSDVYALAATLYHLITGQAPLPATDRAAGVELEDVRAVNHRVSAHVADAVMSGLAMEVNRRPQSAHDFLVQLTGAANGVSSRTQHEGQPALATLMPQTSHNSTPVTSNGLAATGINSRLAPLPRNGFLSSTPHQTIRAFKTLKGHRNKITAVAFSPDGRTIASASHDKTVKLWDARTGELSATLEGHHQRVAAVAFAPDGNTLASGGYDGVVHLWNPWSQGLQKSLYRSFVHMLLGHDSWITSIAYAPDGKTLACGSSKTTFSGGDVTLWDIATGEILRPFDERRWVNGLVFSPDGRTLAGATIETHVKLWDVPTGKLVKTLPKHNGWVTAVAFSPNGKILASAGEDSYVCLWNIQTGYHLTLAGHAYCVTSVAFSPDGSILASGSYDRTIRLWNVETGDFIGKLDEHSNRVTTVAISPDGTTLASGSFDNTVRLWRIA